MYKMICQKCGKTFESSCARKMCESCCIKGRPINEQLNAEAIKRCLSGESIADVAYNLNLSRQHIYDILFKAGYRRTTVWAREGAKP